MLAKLLKPFHFKIFFSNKYVHGMVLDKVTNVVVASVASNNHAFLHQLGEGSSKNNEQACELLGQILADKIKAKQVQSLYWDGVINQKSNRRDWKKQADAVWETLEDEGPSQMWRDEPPSQKEVDDRRHAARLARKGLNRESRVDPRFRQQMWKLMRKKPKKVAVPAATD